MVTHVNEVEAPQRIKGTPKASYPYQPDRDWIMQSADCQAHRSNTTLPVFANTATPTLQGRLCTSLLTATRSFIPEVALLSRTLERYPAVEPAARGRGSHPI